MPRLGELRAGVPFLRKWTGNKRALYDLGVERAAAFCRLNGVPMPTITLVPRSLWCGLGACAYYRPDIESERKWRLEGHGPGINVCLDHCGTPCGPAENRNWTWPGSTTDRDPYGVVCHELGHHCDWTVGVKKGRYYSEFCEEAKAASGEPGLTSYAEENPAEWLAEALRLFITNPYLLQSVRPKTFAVLSGKWKPLPSFGWRAELGANVPDRILRTLRNKGAR